MRVLASFLGFICGWSVLAIGITIGKFLSNNPKAWLANLVRLAYLPVTFTLLFLAPALYLETKLFKDLFIPYFLTGFIVRVIVLFYGEKLKRKNK
jgi:hypothetical protein